MPSPSLPRSTVYSISWSVRRGQVMVLMTTPLIQFTRADQSGASRSRRISHANVQRSHSQLSRRQQRSSSASHSDTRCTRTPFRRQFGQAKVGALLMSIASHSSAVQSSDGLAFIVFRAEPPVFTPGRKRASFLLGLVFPGRRGGEAQNGQVLASKL